MAVQIVRLGTPRARDEGLRIGTVRRPPRAVPKSEFASRDFYDVWLPELSPSDALVKRALAATTAREWQAFTRHYRAEMNKPEPQRLLTLLATFSHQTNFSVGCYCEDESHCHRSVLRELLAQHGGKVK